MPIIGAVTGGLDFSNYFIALSAAVTANSYLDAKSRARSSAMVNFLTAGAKFRHRRLCVLFLVIKAINKIEKQEQAAKEIPADVKLLTEIRDLLAQQRPA